MVNSTVINAIVFQQTRSRFTDSVYGRLRPCMFDLGNTKNKWLDHMEESHKDEFDDLVQRIRLSNQALHEAIQNIVDDEHWRAGPLFSRATISSFSQQNAYFYDVLLKFSAKKKFLGGQLRPPPLAP